MQKYFTINFIPIINGKFQEQMITGLPSTDVKSAVNGMVNKLTDKLKDQHQTTRVEIMNVVTKPVSESDYKKLEPSFFKFD
ncbi:MAG TPA: hypothetical protein PLY34_09735 [Ferruginibacter sp.]|nr:hypothetical protein [Ferruginibacter sp.]HPH91557.1 hypothetical protein [Ferruginibacter sp.]